MENLVTLDYGRPASQFGLVVEHRDDGGVQINVPGRVGRALARRAASSSGFRVAVWMFLARLLGENRRGRPAARIIIRLTRRTLTVREPGGEGNMVGRRRRWGLARVAEIRPNRYSNGVYFSITRCDNFDLLGDLPPDLVQYVGLTLQETLARLKGRTGRSGDGGETPGPAPTPASVTA